LYILIGSVINLRVDVIPGVFIEYRFEICHK